jgi:pyruvate kinase
MKIVCSMGPNIKGKIDIDNLAKAGMNMMRFNFSHINYELAKELMIYAKESYPKIPIIQDLQGNKLRISSLLKRTIRVHPNEEIFFCSEDFYSKNYNGSESYILIPIKLEGKFSLIYESKNILMKDATMEFKVDSRIKDKELIKTTVVRGGIIRGEKGINVPNIDRRGMGLTGKDKRDILFGLKNRVDIICLSYVTSEKNINELKVYINKLIKNNPQYKYPKIWAKVECKEAIRNFHEILKAVDGIMLGRGDLSAEVDITEMPKIQSQLINIMKKSKKEFIIATYILESMKYSTIPNVAEVNEIYNFISNQVSGVMLAGEVSVGKYPLETVSLLKRTIDRYK